MNIISSLLTWGNTEQLIEQIGKLMKVGVCVYRVNLKTVTSVRENQALQNKISQIILKYPKIEFIYDISFPQDSPRLKILSDSMKVCKGEEYLLSCDPEDYEKKYGNNKVIFISNTEQIITNQKVIYNNGEFYFHVIRKINSKKLIVTPSNSSKIWDGKSLHWEHCLSKGNINKVYERLIPYLRLHCSGVALSFVENADPVYKIRRMLPNEVKLFAKIESKKGIDKINEILDATSNIIIGRGDLGLECKDGKEVKNAIERVCLLQKNTNANLLIATEILESFTNRKIPSRSDMMDFELIREWRPTSIFLSSGVSFSENALDCIHYINGVGKNESDFK